MRPLVACIALMLVPGCVEEPTPYPAACGTEGPLTWGALDGRYAHSGVGDTETDPRQPWRTVLGLRGDPSFGVESEVGNASIEWIGNATQRLAIVSQDPPARAVQLTVTADGVDCIRLGAPGWYPGPPREGALVEVGKGALVHTAGFLEDGTLFYTNIFDVNRTSDGDEPWPRTDWYEFTGDDPLPVYVYDRDRSEIPPHWGVGTGIPDPLAPQGFDVGDDLPGRYFTTIPGFNEALKGLSTATVKVVRIPPEDAYTRPGNEEHPLYGHPLVFLIQVRAVADQPCPLSAMDWNNVPNEACFRR